MRKNMAVESALDLAEQEGRCVYSVDHNLRRALDRRVEAKELINPLPYCYCRIEYWQTLESNDKLLHLCRAIQYGKPNVIFAGECAAVIHGLKTLKADQDDFTVICATDKRARKGNGVHFIYSSVKDVQQVNGLLVTDLATTLIDCGLTLGFPQALGIYDAALRNGFHWNNLFSRCSRCRRNLTPIFRLAHYADAKSENGGESFVRALIIMLGFMLPVLQVEFQDRQTGRLYRVDFLWHLPDGRIVVVEYDGLQKYTDPGMKGGQPLEIRIQRERERDAALHRCGVTEIIHVFSKDLKDLESFKQLLMNAGIPLSPA